MTKTLLSTSAAFLSLALLAGCGKNATPTSETAGSPSDAQSSAQDDAGGMTAEIVDVSDSKINKLVATQKVCPVSGGELGSMGDPLAVRLTDAQGTEQTMLLCCEHCLPDVKENPEKYLAKLAEAQANEPQPEPAKAEDLKAEPMGESAT